MTKEFDELFRQTVLEVRAVQDRYEYLQDAIEDETADESEIEEWNENHKDIEASGLLHVNMHATLYAEDYFTADVAREFAADTAGSVDFNAWPFNNIDWSEAASEMQNDYSCFEIGSHTYYTNDG